MAFTREDTLVVRAAMREAWEHVQALFPPAEGEGAHKTSFTDELMDQLIARPAYALVALDGIPDFVDLVFSTVVIRDIVLELQFEFFARWGEGESKITALVDSLSVSLGIDDKQSDYSAMPKAYRDHLANVSDVKEVLSNNKWLLTLVLLKLYGTEVVDVLKK